MPLKPGASAEADAMRTVEGKMPLKQAVAVLLKGKRKYGAAAGPKAPDAPKMRGKYGAC